MPQGELPVSQLCGWAGGAGGEQLTRDIACQVGPIPTALSKPANYISQKPCGLNWTMSESAEREFGEDPDGGRRADPWSRALLMTDATGMQTPAPAPLSGSRNQLPSG